MRSGVLVGGCVVLACMLTYFAVAPRVSPITPSDTPDSRISARSAGAPADRLVRAQRELEKTISLIRQSQADPPHDNMKEVSTKPAEKPIPPVTVKTPQGAAPGGKRVAIAISFDKSYMDGARVLAHTVHQHMSKKWPIQMVALLHPKAYQDKKFRSLLASHGYMAVEAALEFDSSKIETHPIAGATLRDEIDKSGCCGMAELAKLQAWKLTEYEWVLILDADSLVLTNLDKIFENEKADIQYTLDRGLGGRCVNGGFVMFRPSKVIYKALWETIRKGDWRSGTAWGGKNVGYCYGGPTFQGVVPYYYQYVHKPTGSKGGKIIVDLDSCIYNNMGTNKNKAGRSQGQVPIKEVSVAHFTYCQKPWYCHGHSGAPICADMHKLWWKARNEMEKAAGYPVTKQCNGGPDDYPKLPSTCHKGSDECE